MMVHHSSGLRAGTAQDNERAEKSENMLMQATKQATQPNYKRSTIEFAEHFERVKTGRHSREGRKHRQLITDGRPPVGKTDR